MVVRSTQPGSPLGRGTAGLLGVHIPSCIPTCIPTAFRSNQQTRNDKVSLVCRRGSVHTMLHGMMHMKRPSQQDNRRWAEHFPHTSVSFLAPGARKKLTHVRQNEDMQMKMFWQKLAYMENAQPSAGCPAGCMSAESALLCVSGHFTQHWCPLSFTPSWVHPLAAPAAYQPACCPVCYQGPAEPCMR